MTANLCASDHFYLYESLKPSVTSRSGHFSALLANFSDTVSGDKVEEGEVEGEKRELDS